MKVFELFGVDVYRYGIFYFISFLTAYLFFVFVAKKKFFAGYSNFQKLLDKGIDDLFIFIILGVIIGGRLGHVLIYNFQYYFSNPFEIFYLWEGGMSFVGGVIGVAVVFIVMKFVYKLRREELFLLSDLAISVVPFGIMLGRIGNFLNQELYGIKVSSDTGFSETLRNLGVYHVYEDVDENLRLNTNFIESFFEGFVLFITVQLIFWKQYIGKSIKPGLITSVFFVGYGIVRFCVEFLREYEASEFIGFLTRTQYFMIGLLLVGIFIFRKTQKICKK